MTRISVDQDRDAERFLKTDHIVWFEEVPAASTEVQLSGVPEDQRFAAEVPDGDPSTYAGIYGVFPMTLSVPGPTEPRQLPVAGLTWVGVHPDQRRKGVLTAMLRDHFERVRDTEGTHVSALHASEPGIYGRFGYGLASLEHDVVLGRGTTLNAPHLEDAAAGITTQLATITEEGIARRMRESHLDCAPMGSVVGSAGYYERICLELPEERRDKESWRLFFARRGGADVGWAVFRRNQKWENGRPSGKVEVWAVVGDPATRLALLRRLVDLDLTGSVKLRGVGADDPLFHWVGGPRATSEIATYDSLWVRLVNLPEALADRSWSADCDVTVEVADTHAPWNAGTWRIVATDGTVEVTRSDADPDLSLPVEALGGAYLGGGNLVALQRAGLVQESRPGAVGELWRALRTDVAPVAALGF